MLESDVPDNPPIPPPGTPDLFTSLLTYIRNTPSTLPLDAVVFQSILLCLIAGDKHLILRTPEEDVGLVVKLATLTLTSVFAYPTHKLKIRRPSSQSETGTAHPTSFLRSLFLPSVSSTSSTNPTFQYESSVNGHKSKQINKRNKQTRSGSRSRSTKPKSKPYTRSVSFPSDLAFAHAHLTTSLSASPDLSREHRWDGLASTAISASPGPSNTFTSNQFTWASTSSSPGPSNSATHHQPNFPHHPSLSHAHTEPTPTRHIQDETSLHLPRALVIMGLENANLPSQRALVRVLAERRVVLEGQDEVSGGSGRGREMWRGEGDEDMGIYGEGGEDYEDEKWNGDLEDEDGVWNLPDGFIMVYVCPWDARERPTVHKSLLDKFAMSTTVILHHTIRHAIRSLSFMSRPISPSHSHSHLHGSSPSRSLPLSLPQVRTQVPNHLPLPLSHSLPLPLPHHHHHGKLAPILFQPLLPPPLLLSLRTSYQHTHFPPHLSLYTSDLFSATRHHPQLDGMLLTAQSMKDAEHLARAGRVLGRDLTGMELVRDTGVEVLGQQDIVDDDDDEEGGEGGELLANDIDVGSGSVKIDLLPPGPDSASYDHALHQQHDVGQDATPPLEVSEADIARIVPRVMSHRLRVRDGPEDEILASAVFGAVKGETEREVEGLESRSTVKDILVKILSEV